MARFEPSGWGQLNAGQTYQVVALDVLRALAHAGLNDYEWILMQVVMEQSWYTSARSKRHEDDWPEPVACKLNVTEFARQLGPEGEPDADWKARRKRLYEARKNLVDSRILAEDGDGLWINKNADEWTRPDGKTGRFAPGRLAYALSARHRKVSEIADTACPEKRACVSGIPGTSIRKNGHACPEKRAFSGSPLHPPIRKRDLDSEEVVVGDAGARDAGHDSGKPERPRRPVVNDPAEVERVAAWAHALGPNDLGELQCLADKVAQFERSYPVAWIEDAILCGLAADAAMTWKYAHGCLLRWWKKGGPDHAEVDQARLQIGPIATVRPSTSEARREAFRADIARKKQETAGGDR